MLTGYWLWKFCQECKLDFKPLLIQFGLVVNKNNPMTKEQAEEMAKWLKELNASGYAGCNRKGNIVDRREEPDAIPVQKNSLFGVVAPKKLENEPHPEYFKH